MAEPGLSSSSNCRKPVDDQGSVPLWLMAHPTPPRLTYWRTVDVTACSAIGACATSAASRFAARYVAARCTQQTLGPGHPTARALRHALVRRGDVAHRVPRASDPTRWAAGWPPASNRCRSLATVQATLYHQGDRSAAATAFSAPPEQMRKGFRSTPAPTLSRFLYCAIAQLQTSEHTSADFLLSPRHVRATAIYSCASHLLFGTHEPYNQMESQFFRSERANGA